MTHAGDWSWTKWENRYFEEPLCKTCDGHGVLVKDITPPNYWETGPVEEEIVCNDCPVCEECCWTITKESHPKSFALRDEPEEYGEPDLIFCSQQCFMLYLKGFLSKDWMSGTTPAAQHARRVLNDIFQLIVRSQCV